MGGNLTKAEREKLRKKKKLNQKSRLTNSSDYARTIYDDDDDSFLTGVAVGTFMNSSCDYSSSYSYDSSDDSSWDSGCDCDSNCDCDGSDW